MAGGLAPSPRGLGRCLGCGTAWERVYSTECTGCGFGWVHIHHPDHVDAVGRQPVFAPDADSSWQDVGELSTLDNLETAPAAHSFFVAAGSTLPSDLL